MKAIVAAASAIDQTATGRCTDRGAVLHEEGDQGDERHEAELISTAEHTLNRAAAIEPTEDAQKGDRAIDE